MCGFPVTPVAPTAAKVMALFVMASHNDNWVSERRPAMVHHIQTVTEAEKCVKSKITDFEPNISASQAGGFVKR